MASSGESGNLANFCERRGGLSTRAYIYFLRRRLMGDAAARWETFTAGRERRLEERVAESAHRAGQLALGVAAEDVARYVPPDWDDPCTSIVPVPELLDLGEPRRVPTALVAAAAASSAAAGEPDGRAEPGGAGGQEAEDNELAQPDELAVRDCAAEVVEGLAGEGAVGLLAAGGPAATESGALDARLDALVAEMGVMLGEPVATGVECTDVTDAPLRSRDEVRRGLGRGAIELKTLNTLKSVTWLWQLWERRKGVVIDPAQGYPSWDQCHAFVVFASGFRQKRSFTDPGRMGLGTPVGMFAIRVCGRRGGVWRAACAVWMGAGAA